MRLRTFLWIVGAVALTTALPFLGAEPLDLGALNDPASVSHRILFSLRLPRLLAVLVAGGALAVLGGTYQSLFHNPLAEPYLLGVSSAVTLAVALGELFLGVAFLTPGSLLLGLGAAGLSTLSILWIQARRPSQEVILFGLGLQFVLSSILFLTLSYHHQSVGGGSLRWLFGQIPWFSFSQTAVFTAVAAPLVLYFIVGGRTLDALSLGDAVARSLGVNPPRQRALFVGLSSILVAWVVATTGAIGFVGLVVPHAVRLVARPAGHRSLLWLSALGGALFLGVADTVSRTLLPPFEFPIGILTTLLGGPLFLYLLGRRP